MHRIRANHAVKDIRSGMSDKELMVKYDLSYAGLQQLMKMLIHERVIDHEVLYDTSPAYRAIADLIVSRRAPRVYVPMAISVYGGDPPQKGFIRDVSENGLRVAGIDAAVGSRMKLRLPLKELLLAEPLEFEAVCRWSQTKGRNQTYEVRGFEIVEISREARAQYRKLINVFRMQESGQDRILYTPLNLPELPNMARTTGKATESSHFSGHIDGVDILELVQFLLVTGRKTILSIESGKGQECLLYLDSGRIIHSSTGALEGKDAFYKGMAFSGGTFRTKLWEDPRAHTIDEPGELLVMEAARRRDEVSDETGPPQPLVGFSGPTQVTVKNLALMDAIANGHLFTTEQMLEQGADANAVDQTGKTALILACRNGATKIVNALLQAGANVNSVDSSGNSPLVVAARSGTLELSALLLDHGADVNASNAGGQTALLVAVNGGHWEMARLLVAHGADVEAMIFDDGTDSDTASSVDKREMELPREESNSLK